MSIAVAAVDVYVLGHVARPKTAETTFAMLAWLAPVPALIMSIAYALGSRATKPPAAVSAAIGAAVSLLFWLVALAFQQLPAQYGIPATWVACLCASYFAPRLMRRNPAIPKETS